MSFFQQSQSTFRTMFSNDENSRPQNTRNKMPNIDIDPLRIFGSLFAPKSNSSPTVKSVCENCNAKFGLLKAKKICNSCKFEFCSPCFRLETDLGQTTTRSTSCTKCRVFSKRPLKREDLIKLKVKDLKWFLRSHRISSNLCREKSDLVDLIIQNFSLRNTNQSNQQAGPSRRSFDDNTAFNRRENNSTRNSSASTSQTASPLRSATSTNIAGNNNGDSNGSSTLGSEWEIVNDRTSSNSNSNQNSNHNSNNPSPTTPSPANFSTTVNNDLNSEFTNLSATGQTRTQPNDPSPTVSSIPSNPTVNDDLNSEFINLSATGDTRSEVNSNDINFTYFDDNAAAFTSDNQPNSSSNVSGPNRQSGLNDNGASNLDATRRTASTSRLSNPNLNNLNKSTNLSDSTESLSSFKNFNISDVNSEVEIKSLSVRQLKLVLTRNYVNYKGCCEKDELQEKAIRLWKQIRLDNEMIDDSRDEDICKICMENVINCVLLECGHLAVCLDCGKRLSECPICRQYVIRAIRTFKS